MLAVVKDEACDFFNMTSLHGVKFIANRKTLTERILWMLVCSSAVLGILLMTTTIWTAYQTSPTQTIVENPSLPVWNIDFPALTVCNLNKVQLSKAKTIMPKILGSEHVDNDTEVKFLDTLLAYSLMRYPYYHHPLLFLREGKRNLIDFGDYNISDIMHQVMATHKDIFGTCYWKGREIPCARAFRLQITEEGYCYSFNSKTSETPIPPDVDSPPFQTRRGVKQPWRNNAAGKTTGLEVFFKSSEEEYLPGDKRIPGYSLIVHHPDEYPDVSRSVFLPRSNGRMSLLAVTASRVDASPDLERLALKDRGCRLRGDHEGQDMLEEVQTNCWAQCRISTIAKKCKCVPYFGLHRVPVGTPQCTMKDIGCLAAYNVQQRNILPPAGSKGFRKSDLDLAMACLCPPSCSSTTFKTEFISVNRIDPFPFDDYAYLDVFFKDLEIVSYVRDVKFGIMDLIVSFGGMAGLFLGFSLISAVEFIYYVGRAVFRMVSATVRPRRKPATIDKVQVLRAQITTLSGSSPLPIKKKAAWKFPDYYP